VRDGEGKLFAYEEKYRKILLHTKNKVYTKNIIYDGT